MITKIYEDYTEEITEQVMKKVEKVEEETRYKVHTRTRYTRCGLTGTPRCLCCHVVLEDRMWKYGNKNNKYLCKDCWYDLSYDDRNYYASLRNQGYDSVEFFEERIPYTVRVKKVVNELVEEKKSISRKRLANMPNHPYPIGNRLILNELEKFTVLMEQLDPGKRNIQSVELANDSEWFGAHSIEEVKECILENKPMEFRDMQNVPDIAFGYENAGETVVFEEMQDVVGYYPNVPYYIQGHPLDMFNVRCIRTQRLRKTVHLWCNLAIDSMDDQNAYYKRGITIFNLVEYFRNFDNSTKVVLTILDATFINGESIIQRLDFDDDTYLVNRNAIFNLLTDICAYRVAFLNSKMNIIQSNNLSSSWAAGYGFAMNSVDVRQIMSIGEDDIYLGLPDEIKVHNISRSTHIIDCSRLGIFNDKSDSHRRVSRRKR